MPTLSESIHAAHLYERLSVIEAFESSSDLQKRALRMHDCGSHGRLYMEGYPPQVRLWIHRCGDRLCPLCSQYRAKQIRDQLMGIMKQCENVRHMVLTLSNYPAGKLAEGISHLRASFTRLRKHSGFRESVRGGAYILEITRSTTDGTWHPHLHIIWDGDYIRQQHLSALWVDASHGSSVVWVSKASPRHAAYLAKYAGKPVDLKKWPKAAIVEYALCTSRSRMVQTFGNLHGTGPVDKDERPEPAKLRSAVSLRSLFDAARNGHAAAEMMCKLCCRRWPRLFMYLRGAIDLPPPTTNWEEREDIEELDAQITNTARFMMDLSLPLEKIMRKMRKSVKTE